MYIFKTMRCLLETWNYTGQLAKPVTSKVIGHFKTFLNFSSVSLVF